MNNEQKMSLERGILLSQEVWRHTQTQNFLLTCIRSRTPWGPAACSRGRCRRRRRAWCASCPRPASSPACCTGRPGNSSLRAADVARGLAPLSPPLCAHTSVWMHRLDYFSTTAASNTRQKTVKDFIWCNPYFQLVAISLTIPCLELKKFSQKQPQELRNMFDMVEL